MGKEKFDRSKPHVNIGTIGPGDKKETFEDFMCKIPGYARSGFNRSLARQIWEHQQQKIDELKKARDAYFLGDPIMTDVEYDILVELASNYR